MLVNMRCFQGVGRITQLGLSGVLLLERAISGCRCNVSLKSASGKILRRVLNVGEAEEDR
jgi:hypothetical protein